ncbi:MAG: hypothetical protein AAF297_01850 [Planctomycetota bacterium]
MPDEIFALLNNEETLFLMIGGTIAVTAIVFCTITGCIKQNARERTRREIAAYIAEGSMTPDQGERLIRAKFKDD